MSAPKHTPGPWKLETQRDPDGCPVNLELVDAEGRIICLLPLDEELDGAARVIAAAPEMLEALKAARDANELLHHLVTNADERMISIKALAAINAAIRKAEGA